MKIMLKERVSVWEHLCEENGGEKKVVGRCNVCKLSAAKKCAMQRVAEAEAAGQDETLTDADIDAADASIPESTNDWCCMYRVTSLQEDFKTEKPMIQHFLEDQGHKVVFLPKFHCEFAAIEMLWGFGKYRALYPYRFSCFLCVWQDFDSSMMESSKMPSSSFPSVLIWQMWLRSGGFFGKSGVIWMPTGERNFKIN